MTGYAGARELERRVKALAERLPPPLGVFARLAFNYRWSWALDGRDLFRAIDSHRWLVCGENPVRLLEEAPVASLRRAAGDAELVGRAEALESAIRAELARPFAIAPERPVAFLCAECAIHGSLPIYAGGLGVLAGDLLKEASDRAIPLVAVSILYRQGQFRQRLDKTGSQVEAWVDADPERLPAALVTDDAGEPLLVRVPLDEHEVVAQIWRVDVGRVPLYLLDTERPENARIDRWIGARLYVGDRQTRLAQYALLGIGGHPRPARARHRPGRRPPERGARGPRDPRARAGGDRARRGPRGRAGRRPVAHGVHHAHAGRRGQRGVPARGDLRGPGRAS